MLLLYTFRSLVLEQHQSIVQEEFPMGKPLYIALLRLLRLLEQKIVHFDKALKCKNMGVSLIHGQSLPLDSDVVKKFLRSVEYLKPN